MIKCDTKFTDNTENLDESINQIKKQIIKSYLITYDLNKSGQNYTILVEKIKSFERYQHCMDSIWLIKTTDSAVQIRNFLKPCIDINDELLIVELNGEAAWLGLGKRCVKWINENL